MKTLREEVKRFDESDPYTLGEVFNPHTGEYRMILSGITPPPTTLPVIVGDILHNLRSALDHIVWQLTIANGNTPPPFPLPKKSPWKNIQFPIFLDKHEFTNSAVPRYLWGVGDKARRFIERMQPFDTPDHPLWLLSELSNIDKHRTLAVTSSYLRNVTLVRPPGSYIVPEFLRPPGFLEGKTEVARVTLVPIPKLPMDMERGVQIEVVFGRGMASAEGQNIITALGRMGLTTEKILKGSRPYIRMRP